MATKHILLTGGGTGGHTYPLIAVARALRKQHGDAETIIQYIGPHGPLEEREREAFSAENIKTTFVSAGKVRRYASWQNIIDPFRTIWGILQSLYHVLVYMPDVVFAKGGYGAVPVVIAAWIYRIPIMVHESDAIPGVANRILGKLARRIAITYPRAKQFFRERKVALTGIPVRRAVAHGNAERAYARHHLSPEKPLVVVIGGSQGAQALNIAIIDAAPKLIKHTQILHQTGPTHREYVTHAVARHGIKAGRDGYTAVDFLSEEEMGDALAAATLVISRAGASAIAEIAAHSTAAILVPLRNSANNHQYMNAFAVAEVGGAVVLEEGNIGPDMLSETIEELLNDVALRTAMGARIERFYHPHAAARIAHGLLEMT